MPDLQITQWIIDHRTEIATGVIGVLSALGTFYVKWKNVNVAEITSTNDYVAKNMENMMKHIEIQGAQIERQMKMIAYQSEQISKLTDELELARQEIRKLREQNDELLTQIHELEELLRKKG